MSTIPVVQEATDAPSNELKITIPDAPAGFTPEELEFRKKVIAEIVPGVYKQIQASLDVAYAKQLADAVDELTIKFGQKFEKEMETYRASLKPITPADIQTLLSQEYITFTVPVHDAGTGEEKIFVLQELPQAVEQKFYKQFQATIVGKLQDIEALKMTLTEGSLDDKIHGVISLLGSSFEVLADTVALILNPFDKEKDIDKAWVQANLSTWRQMNIVQAQTHVNRLRDFFSQVSQLTQS